MSSDSPPPPRPTVRRFVGPVRELLEDGTDVTAISERDMIKRLMNEVLALGQAVGNLARELARIAERVDGRRSPSMPEVAQQLVDAVEEITDHGQHRAPKRTDSDPVKGVVKRVLDDAELEAARLRRQWLIDVARQGVGVLAGAGLLELGKVLFTGHW